MRKMPGQFKLLFYQEDLSSSSLNSADKYISISAWVTDSQVSVWVITHSDFRKETGQDAFKTPHVLNQDKHNLESYSEGTLKMD